MLPPEEIEKFNVVSPTNSYSSEKIQAAIEAFADKYADLPQEDEVIGGVRWKKVIGKEIYFADVADDEPVIISSDINLLKPATFVISTGVVVRGNIQGSSMWLVKGQVKFDPANVDEPQVVDGIWIAKDGFDKTRIRNDDLNKEWAKRGDLKVRGILIGNGVDEVKENGRSVLGDIWRVDANIYKLIIDGASLKIVTNPMLWIAPPPGIVDLLQAVQRQTW